MNFNTIIIGGGVSGIMCAYQLHQAGIDFVLLEKNDSLGKKLLITGGSRCNVTNNLDINSFINSISLKHKRFLYSALDNFGTKEIVDFFNNNNCPLELNEDFKYFPKSNKSSDVLEVFSSYIPKNKIRFNFDVKSIKKTDNGFAVESDDTIINSINLVIATGSKSYPHTGSTGDGIKFGKSLGLDYSIFTPAETHVYSSQVVNELIDLQGSSLKNVIVSIKDTRIKMKGDVLFTHFGLSGPAIMHLSEDIYDLLQIDKVVLSVPLTNLSKEDLDELFAKARINNYSTTKTLEACTTKNIANILVNRLNIKKLNIPDINKNTITILKELLLGYEINIDKVQEFSKSYVNKGGISTKELEPKTMESKKFPGLYFIGETVDLHGPIGGYNITIAFSTAVAAAKSIIINQ